MRTKEAIACGSIYIAGTEDGDLYSWHITDEEIVRCRDCEYAEKSIEGYWCDELCRECTDEPVYVGNGNRFCAWGVRRNEAV